MMLEQVSWMTWEPPSYLNGGLGGSRILQLPEHLPDPCYIVACEISMQGAIPPSGHDALIMIKLDHGGRFTAGSGYPASEICGPNDPNCQEQLYRLCVLDYRGGGTRFKRTEHNPVVSYSRSRGDLLQVNSSGAGGASAAVPIQVCWTLYYLRPGTYTPNDELLLPPINPVPPPPPPGAFDAGSWSNPSNGIGGRTINATYPVFGMRFTAPQAGVLQSAKFKVITLRAGATVAAILYADNAGAVGAQIGASSALLAVSAAGDQVLSFASGPSLVQDTAYWIAVEPETGVLDADVDVSNDHPSFASGRAASAAQLTNNLPNSDDWRMEIIAT